MKKTAVLYFILFYTTCVFSQIIHFDIKNKTINDFVKYEESENSERLDNESTFHSYKPVEQPITFKREQDVIPNLLTTYTFYKGDSIMESIVYNWDANERQNVDDPTFIEAMIKTYDSLAIVISKRFGRGSSRGSHKDLEQITQEHGLNKSAKWRTAEDIEVRLSLTLWDFTKAEATLFESAKKETSHKIHLIVTNKSKREQTKPKSEQELRDIASSFFNDMQAKDYDKALTYFGEGYMSKTYSHHDLKKIEHKIKSKEAMKFVNAISMMADAGVSYMFLNYEHHDGQKLKLIFNSSSGELLAIE